MKHKIGFNKLNRTPAHRKAMLGNMTTVLFKHERIVTTRAKAIECRRVAEKMITRAKEDNVHNRRLIAERIHDEAILAKLFKEIGPRMKDRNGGYTRIIRMGTRAHDAADMVVLELVDRAEDNKKAERDKRKADKKAKAKAKADAAEAEAEKAKE
jgi:large subunit ribosomal protein L17